MDELSSLLGTVVVLVRTKSSVSASVVAVKSDWVMADVPASVVTSVSIVSVSLDVAMVVVVVVEVVAGGVVSATGSFTTVSVSVMTGADVVSVF